MNFLEEPIVSKDVLMKADIENKEVVVTLKSKKKSKRFDAMGVENMKAIYLLADLTRPEAFVFKKLESLRDYRDNMLEFSTATLSSTDKVVFVKGFKGLETKEIVKRIKRGSPSIYMFNPDFILPLEYTDAIALWSGKTTKSTLRKKKVKEEIIKKEEPTSEENTEWTGETAFD